MRRLTLKLLGEQRLEVVQRHPFSLFAHLAHLLQPHSPRHLDSNIVPRYRTMAADRRRNMRLRGRSSSLGPILSPTAVMKEGSPKRRSKQQSQKTGNIMPSLRSKVVFIAPRYVLREAQLDDHMHGARQPGYIHLLRSRPQGTIASLSLVFEAHLHASWSTLQVPEFIRDDLMFSALAQRPSGRVWSLP